MLCIFGEMMKLRLTILTVRLTVLASGAAMNRTKIPFFQHKFIQSETLNKAIEVNNLFSALTSFLSHLLQVHNEFLCSPSITGHHSESRLYNLWGDERTHTTTTKTPSMMAFCSIWTHKNTVATSRERPIASDESSRPIAQTNIVCYFYLFHSLSYCAFEPNILIYTETNRKKKKILFSPNYSGGKVRAPERIKHKPI